MAILLGGGHFDPNLTALAGAAGELGVAVADLRHGPTDPPMVSWDLYSDALVVRDGPAVPSMGFVRWDVFGAGGDGHAPHTHRAQAWYALVHGWLLAHPEVRMFNRHMSAVALNKPAVLALARATGLPVAPTVFTNSRDTLERPGEPRIAKPIAGGDYCYDLDEVLPRVEFRDGAASAPAIAQHRLQSPEVRVYVVGRRRFAFEMRSTSLDYRVRQDVEVVPLSDAPEESTGLGPLMRELRMDFGAADFKTDARSGRLTFLELNTSPMFARFDAASGGELARAMVQELCGRHALVPA